MDIVLWDRRARRVVKEAAGGFGAVGHVSLGGIHGLVLDYLAGRDRAPAPLIFAILAGVFRRLGHHVRYLPDCLPPRADAYVFCPSLPTVDVERRMAERLLARESRARILVVGPVASILPEAFQGLDVTLVQGEAEQLLWKFDEVIERSGGAVQLGLLEDLDRLPPADWSPFDFRRFRLPREFWRFPTAYVEQSRGCSLGCSYCPTTALEGGVRFRDPRAVVEEIRDASRRWGFRSFKFRDPTFGLNRALVFQLAEYLGRLDRRIQFSIETRSDLMRPEVLRVLKRVGLSCVTVGVETPDLRMLQRHGRAAVEPECHRDLVALCRSLGIRTTATFMIGFPGETEESVLATLEYAQSINPTFAQFHLVTPYPGTRFAAEQEGAAEGRLPGERLESLLETCFRRFYFRRAYLVDNAHLVWPGLRRWGPGRERRVLPHGQGPHDGPPQPAGGLDALRHRGGLRQDGPHARHAH